MEAIQILYAIGIFAAGIIAKRAVDGKPPLVNRTGRAPIVVTALDWLRALAVRVSGGQPAPVPGPTPAPAPSPSVPGLPAIPPELVDLLKQLLIPLIDERLKPLLPKAEPPYAVLEEFGSDESPDLIDRLRAKADEYEEFTEFVRDLAQRFEPPSRGPKLAG